MFDTIRKYIKISPETVSAWYYVGIEVERLRNSLKNHHDIIDKIDFYAKKGDPENALIFLDNLQQEVEKEHV